MEYGFYQYVIKYAVQVGGYFRDLYRHTWLWDEPLITGIYMIIYKITNKINGKIYVGQTVRNISSVE